MIDISRRPDGSGWLTLVPPAVFLALASLTLAAARHLYRWRIVRFRDLRAAFAVANALARAGMASWRRRQGRADGGQR